MPRNDNIHKKSNNLSAIDFPSNQVTTKDKIITYSSVV